MSASLVQLQNSVHEGVFTKAAEKNTWNGNWKEERVVELWQRRAFHLAHHSRKYKVGIGFCLYSRAERRNTTHRDAENLNPPSFLDDQS